MTLGTVEFLLGETATNIRRNGLMSVACVSNAAVALCILGSFIVCTVNLGYMAGRLAAQGEISVWLRADFPEAKAHEVEAAIAADARVDRHDYVTGKAALAELSKELGFDPTPLQDANPLPASFRVTVVKPEDSPAVVKRLQQIPGVDEVTHPKEILEKLTALNRMVRVGGLTLSGLLSLATLLIIYGTIRLTVWSRRREIRIMQLVGATDWFIRLPFLFEGLVYGLVGAVVAVALLIPGYAAVTQYLEMNLAFIRTIPAGSIAIGLPLTLALAGILFGAIGALISTRRFLAEV